MREGEQLTTGYMVLVVVVHVVADFVLFSPISFQTMPPSWEISYEVTGEPPSFSGGVQLISTLSVSSLPSWRTADATSVVGGPGTFCSPCGAEGRGGGRKSARIGQKETEQAVHGPLHEKQGLPAACIQSWPHSLRVGGSLPACGSWGAPAGSCSCGSGSCVSLACTCTPAQAPSWGNEGWKCRLQGRPGGHQSPYKR